MRTIQELLDKQKVLMEVVPHGLRPDVQGKVVAGLGLIEEILEYLSACGHKSWRPQPLSREKQLEEIADIQFFNAELILLSGFSWDEIAQEYDRKHAENLDRYRRGKEGDYGWDSRGKGL